MQCLLFSHVSMMRALVASAFRFISCYIAGYNVVVFFYPEFNNAM